MRTGITAVTAGIVGSLLTLMWSESQVGPLPLAEAQLTAPRVQPGGAATAQPALPSTQLTPAGSAVTTPAPITDAERIHRGVYERCNRGVVNISVTTVRRSFLGAYAESGDSGSGVVIDTEGHVITNYHVVEGASAVTVTLADGNEYEGDVVGLDPLNDIAILKIDAPATDLTVIPLGTSSDLFVGQAIYAIGNPFGLQRTLSTGIIASLGRSLHVREDWVIKSVIQIDAAINPGNSGGPLLDAAGRLIGINTAIAARAQQSAGIGFAIPVDLIRRSLPDLLEHGRVIRGDLGITVSETRQGLMIARIQPKGPAARAGLRGPVVVERREGNIIMRRLSSKAADVIVAVDGEQVTDAAEFFAQIAAKKPGESVELTVIRDRELVTVTVPLGEE